MAEQLGWLDTNVFIHALFPNDPHYSRCRALLEALDEGRAEGWMDVTVVHELTYTLSRQRAFKTHRDVRDHLRNILNSTGIRIRDRGAVEAAITIWTTTGIGFVDAWLSVLARREGLPVCSVNARDSPGIANSYRDAKV